MADKKGGVKKSNKVMVYSTSWCPWCKKVKEFLKENKIKFTNRDVEKSKKYADEMIKKSRQKGIPVTIINGKVIVGFEEDKMRKELKIKSKKGMFGFFGR